LIALFPALVISPSPFKLKKEKKPELNNFHDKKGDFKTV